MVLPTDYNEEQFHGRTFKGFVQFQEPDGTEWFRLKERQNMTFTMNYSRVDHYTDDGRKVLDPSGHNHTFNMTIKLTSDLFDNEPWTYTNGILDSGIAIDKETLSYWIYKSELNDPVEVIFVTSFETLLGPGATPTQKDVNIKFVLDPSGFATGLGPAGGSPSITVSGTVVSITSALRSTTTDQ